MLDLSLLPTFIVLSVVVIIAPGADTMLLIRSSMDGGVRRGFATFAGIHVGNVILTTLVASGVGLVIANSPVAMLVVQLAGGLYLLWLALGAVRSVLRQWRNPDEDEAGHGASVAGSGRQSFTQGIVSNLTNPKLLVFYLSFFPQFIGHARSSFAQLELLAVVFIVLAMVWQALVILLAARMQHLMQRRGFAIGLEVLSALVFLGLGGVILVEALH